MPRKFIYAGIAVIIVCATVFGVYQYNHRNQIIPHAIKKQLSVVTLIPKGNQFIVDKTSFKYEPSAKALTFVVSSFGVKNIISEQVTPDSINDIPQYLDKLTESLNAYTSFDSVVGKVYLTRPKELSGEQSAVMNTKGVLLFAHPVKDLTDDQWRQFFNSLEIIK